MIKLTSPKSLSSIVEQASVKLSEALSILGGPDQRIPALIHGDGEALVWSLSSASEAQEGSLCFAVKKDFFIEARDKGAAAIIVSSELFKELAPDQAALKALGPLNLVVFIEPRLLFSVVLGLVGGDFAPDWAVTEPFFKDRASCSIEAGVTFGPNVYLGAQVTIGRGTKIGPGVFLDDGVSIGQDCLIHPGAVLRFGVKVGNRCQIHANSVIGEDGFGYNQVPCPEKGRLIHFKNPHLGTVIIEDDVEIGALTAIDRGLVADTVIGQGTKIDNLVQIGHNCQIGRDCVVVSQVGAAGHSQVGDRVFLLGQSGLNHGAKVGHDAIISGQSGVLGQVPPGKNVWTGTPVKPQREEYTTQVMVKNDLPKWRKFLKLFLKGQSWEDIRKAMSADGEKN
ncbi:MAG: UDP-3-O-(3-hydroxymyristoyl)glucosamine N-acyltransferase [Deltaproteobacteria bacterium]|jgi:UDP-3-O-[3-hydroxymyristoyl] glucosamine N-acyltransferase|nr:UDP-3-O-(3-hydroxymyristoyl)glucosamine N-acyltransferase [Deltaproteobacteria bacterium]